MAAVTQLGLHLKEIKTLEFKEYDGSVYFDKNKVRYK